MYQAIYSDKKTSTIHLWDDTRGYINFEYKPCAYKKKKGGPYTSIYGDELEKITRFNPRDPSLFQSDVPWDTDVLINAYGDSDDVSINHRIAILDIEVETVGGYPNMQTFNQPITAIAVYSSVDKKYTCYVLDESGAVKNSETETERVYSFKTEEDLILSFLDGWEKISPTIASGWNCIPVNSRIYAAKEILEIGSVQPALDLGNGNAVEYTYPRSKKEVCCIKLANGHTIRSSPEHRFRVLSIDPERYTTLNVTRKNFGYLSQEDVALDKIDRNKSNFLIIPVHENTNVGVNVTDDELYLAGVIYTDGSLREKTNKKSGYRIYQSSYLFLESFGYLSTKIVGNEKRGFARSVRASFLEKAHDLIYDETGNKKLNVNLLSKLSTRQFYIFLSGILDGDGCGTNGLSSCDYTSTGIDDLYSLCMWNGMFVTKRKNTLRYIDYDIKQLTLRHPTKWKKFYQSLRTLNRNSKQKARQILYKKVNNNWCVRIDAIEKTGIIEEMLDIKTTTGYFLYDGVLTHNCDGFDFPYLHGRITRVIGEKEANRLSPIGIAYFNKYKKKMTIAGINCLDYLLLYKRYSQKNLPNFRLDSVGIEELNIGKIDYEGSLDDLKRDDVKKFIEYNIHDIRLIVMLDEKLQFINLAMTICHVCHVGYEEFHVSSKFLEGALLTYLYRQKLIAPNKAPHEEREYSSDGDEEEESEKFIGAYVKDPEPGLYPWVCSADINSLYPSTIMTLNVSPETKVVKIDNWDPEKYLRKEIEDVVIHGEKYPLRELEEMLVKNNFSVSANGVIYDQNKKGCIPEILKLWFSQRVEFKNKMKDASSAGDKAAEVFWKRRQQVQKILLNSLYGVVGLRGWRFYDRDNAEAITLTGQAIIKSSAKYVNSVFNKRCGTADKDYVIYIDTDSVLGDTKINTASGEEEIKQVFDNLIAAGEDNIIDIAGRHFVFPKKLTLPYYDETTLKVLRGNVKYIEKHRVKKKLYKITTQSGNSVVVTGDHSLMILNSENKLEKKCAIDVKKSDRVIVI